MSRPGTPWTMSGSEALPLDDSADPSMFSNASEAAEFAGFSAGPPAIAAPGERDSAAKPPSSDEAGPKSWQAEPEPGETEEAAWEVDAEAPVIVGSRGFADDAATSSTVDIVSAELAAWDDVFGSVSAQTPGDPDRAASVAASWIPRRSPSRAPSGGSVFSGPVVPPPLVSLPTQEKPPAPVEPTRSALAPAERPEPEGEADIEAEAEAGAEAEADIDAADAEADGWLGPEPLAPGEPQAPGAFDAAESNERLEAADAAPGTGEAIEPGAVAQPADRWWIEPDDAEAASVTGLTTEQPAAIEAEGTEPEARRQPQPEPEARAEPEPEPQGRPEPEPVDSIAASFGVWFPPAAGPAVDERIPADRPLDADALQVPAAPAIEVDVVVPASETASERSRTFAPLSGADRSAAGLTGEDAAPSAPVRALSVLVPVSESAAADDVVGSDSPGNDVGGTRSDEARVLSTLVDRPVPAPSPMTTLTTPERQLHARPGHPAASTVTSAPGTAAGSSDPGTGGDAGVRSPVVAAVLTLLAVLVVAVIVLGFVYMFTSLL